MSVSPAERRGITKAIGETIAAAEAALEAKILAVSHVWKEAICGLMVLPRDETCFNQGTAPARVPY